MARKKRVFQNQRLFTPNVIRRFTNSSGVLRKQTQQSLSGTQEATNPTGSFRFDTPGSPLKSTQQLPFDFSKFENHTFFASAESNVNILFEKVINQFPFDGKKTEYETWLDDLTGYEKHLLDRYPMYTGYLTFRGNGECVEVIDKAGVVFPSLSRKSTGETMLNPKANSFFIEMDLALPEALNANQYIFSHLSSSADDESFPLTVIPKVGYAAFLTGSADSSLTSVVFTVLSASNIVYAKAEFPKGRFQHVSFFYDNSALEKRAYIMSASTVVAVSPRFTFNSINTAGAPLLIATGSGISIPGLQFSPANTLSGSIDNFRIFHKIRTPKQVEYFTKRTLFSEETPLLNFRFNEATGSYTNYDMVLDSSGNSLHSRVTSYDVAMRTDLPYPTLMSFEKATFHPTLFPSHPAVIHMNSELLSSASEYDVNNPNLITNLIPAHYLEMAAQSDWAIGQSPDGELMEGIKTVPAKYSGPGGAKIGQPQIMSSLLFMWAREFDELKTMLDHVSHLVHIDYDKEVGIADQMLPFLAEYYGFTLPNMFRNADYGQLFSGENITGEDPSVALLSVQNEMWRRILINLREIFNSKGTQHAIKSLFRASGIDPDRMFRFMEYGGPAEFRLGQSRKKITEISTLLDFSGSMSGGTGAEDSQGVWSNSPYMRSAFMTGSRIEVGYPPIAGSYIEKETYTPHGISNNPNDGLLTSGSWTIEARYKFPLARNITGRQSLMRIHTTGSGTRTGIAAAEQPLILNLVADPAVDETSDKTITLYCSPGLGATDQVLSLPITGSNIFDGNKWYISFGRKRNDEFDSYVSSSYFINVARQDFGQLVEYYTTSSLFEESVLNYDNVFQRKEDVAGTYGVENASGCFMTIGKQVIGTDSSHRFLNQSSVSGVARTVRFEGQAGHFRFWSKALTTSEVKEHALSFQSLGVENPLVNFGFTPDVTGSFEKLRLDASTDQPVTASNINGRLDLTDFAQQFATGSILTGFEKSKGIIVPERFDYSIISSYYDEPSEENKVRVRGFTEGKNLFEIGGRPAPVYEIPKAEEPQDDSRFSIEFSMMQALNEDIMKIFATLDSLDNILGAPELMFAEEYPGLRDLREVYFNRLTDRVNYKNFFDFFRWLDNSFEVMIENLIPRKTNYLGFNFIIEQHALERAKIAYGSGDVYLGPSERRNLKGIILLRQLIANIRKM